MPRRVKAEAYGDALADVYDRMYPHTDTPQTVEFLSGLAGDGGRVVELGAGTGRISVPLAEKGLRVQAVEASEQMLARLRTRDTGGLVKTVCADFAEFVPDEEVDLCFVVCNTLFMLPEPEQQIDALRRVAESLAPGGTLVVEVYEPSAYHSMTKPNLQVRHLSADQLMLDTLMVDKAKQILVEVHNVIGGGSVSTYTELSRYAWPSELDLMARVAGLSLADRFADWEHTPFGGDAERHVSVYRKAA